jgi:hypothetical protein
LEANVRTLLRSSLVSILALSLIYAPIASAASKAVGVVVHAESALLGAAAVTGGSTVYSGDRLTTRKDGTLRMRVGGGQVYLLAESAATVESVGEGFRAALEQGTVGFATTAAQPAAVLAAGATIRPAGDRAAHGQVTVVGPTELVVASYRGDVEVAFEGETFLVSAGNSYHLTMAPEPQGPVGEGDADAKRRRLLVVWLGIAAAGGLTAFALWRALRSPDAP